MVRLKVALIYFGLAIQLVSMGPLSHAQEGDPAMPPPPVPDGAAVVPTDPASPVSPADSALPAAPTDPAAAMGDNFAPAIPPQVMEDVPAPAGDFMAPYIFDTREGRRNPFRPMVLKDDNSDRAAIGPATPLERYDIDELRLIAIMWDVKNPRAMILDPNREMHIIMKDDRIGRRQGYVATIREGELVVVETADFNGDIVYSTRVMKIEK